MKRILIIPSWFSTPLNPTKGTYIQEQVNFLKQLGFDVRVLFIETNTFPTRKSILPSFNDSKLKLHESENNAPLYYKKNYNLRFFGAKILLSGLINDYINELHKIISDGWKPDIIHAHSTYYGGIVANKLSSNFNIPYFITEHSHPFFNKSNVIDRLAIKSLTQAKKVGFVSYKQAQLFLLQEVDVNYQVVYNLVDEEIFKNEGRALNSGKGKIFTIGIIAYPLKVKDMETFFKGINEFSKHCQQPFQALVVGKDTFLPDADNSKIKEMAEKAGVSDQCVFIKKITRTEIQNYFSKLDVLVSTSIYETYGLAIREALMSGVPIISTFNGGADELLNDSIGIGIQIGDYQTLAKGLLKIQNKEVVFNPNDVRNKILKEAGREAFAKRMLDFYRYDEKDIS